MTRIREWRVGKYYILLADLEFRPARYRGLSWRKLPGMSVFRIGHTQVIVAHRPYINQLYTCNPLVDGE